MPPVCSLSRMFLRHLWWSPDVWCGNGCLRVCSQRVWLRFFFTFLMIHFSCGFLSCVVISNILEELPSRNFFFAFRKTISSSLFRQPIVTRLLSILNSLFPLFWRPTFGTLIVDLLCVCVLHMYHMHMYTYIYVRYDMCALYIHICMQMQNLCVVHIGTYFIHTYFQLYIRMLHCSLDLCFWRTNGLLCRVCTKIMLPDATFFKTSCRYWIFIQKLEHSKYIIKNNKPASRRDVILCSVSVEHSGART